MEWYFVLLIIMVLFGVFILTGMPIAFSFFLVNIIGLYFFMGGEAAWSLLIGGAHEILTAYSLLPVLFFILMGEVLFHSGIVMSAVGTVNRILGGVRGNLSMVAIAAGVILAACSGSSMGTTAALGLTLMPEMRSRGYSKSMSLGPLLGGGSLAIIIPPSFIIIILASLGKMSAGKLLLAGIMPGLLAAFLFFVYIVIRLRLHPDLVPPIAAQKVSASDKIKGLVYLLPLVLIFFLVMGTIFLGIATPTEASALGAAGAFLLAAVYRKLTWDVVRKATLASGLICGLSFFIVMGSKTFSQLLAGSGVAAGVFDSFMLANLPAWGYVVIIQAAVLVMACIMDVISIMMIVIPIFLPLVSALGFDPIWFAIIMLLNMAIGMLTPPFGVLLFVMKGVAPPEDTMGDIFFSGIPYMVILLITMFLVGFFPEIAIWLPNFLM